MTDLAQLTPASSVASPAAADADVGRLLISCPDRPGIVSAITTFLAEAGANIASLEQYSTAPAGGSFFQRSVFHLPGLTASLDELEKSFRVQVAEPLDMTFRLTRSAVPKRVAIMVSKLDHCLLDLLWRHRRGELPITIPLVIGNHAELADQVRPFGVPFVHVPVPKDGKPEAERRHLELLHGNVDLVVLARYMQIISADFLREIGTPLINIHHSFLPAFVGASPYARAKERGVKLVGATAHYVTQDLDEGPIIEQDVVRVGHTHSAAGLARLGADVERAVLSRAVRWHCEDRVMTHGNSTIVL